jgi:hypothetical protein
MERRKTPSRRIPKKVVKKEEQDNRNMVRRFHQRSSQNRRRKRSEDSRDGRHSRESRTRRSQEGSGSRRDSTERAPSGKELKYPTENAPSKKELEAVPFVFLRELLGSHDWILRKEGERRWMQNNVINDAIPTQGIWRKWTNKILAAETWVDKDNHTLQSRNMMGVHTIWTQGRWDRTDAHITPTVRHFASVVPLCITRLLRAECGILW